MNRESRLRKQKKRARYYERRQAQRAAAAFPDWTLPLLDSDPSGWTDAQVIAVSVHPMMTGLGRHPRLVADADWVDNVVRVKSAMSDEDFWHRFLQLLRTTYAWWDPQAGHVNEVAGPYPECESGRVLPARTVESYSGKLWTPAAVTGAVVNPVYTGIGCYPRQIPDVTWVQGVTLLEQRDGMAEDLLLVNVLWALWESFGGDGRPYCVAPFGYMPKPVQNG